MEVLPVHMDLFLTPVPKSVKLNLNKKRSKEISIFQFQVF